MNKLEIWQLRDLIILSAGGVNETPKGETLVDPNRVKNFINEGLIELYNTNEYRLTDKGRVYFEAVKLAISRIRLPVPTFTIPE